MPGCRAAHADCAAAAELPARISAMAILSMRGGLRERYYADQERVLMDELARARLRIKARVAAARSIVARPT